MHHFEQNSKKQEKNTPKKALGARVIITLLSALALTGSASANESMGINVADITGVISDMTGIFPSIGAMVVAIVPTLMILAVVGFILKFFDKILAMIEKIL